MFAERFISNNCSLARSVTGFVFQSKEDYGDPAIGARRREMLTVFFDMLLVLAAMIVWFVISAAIAEVGP